MVILNGAASAKPITLPAGRWTLVANGDKVSQPGLGTKSKALIVPATTAYILHQ